MSERVKHKDSGVDWLGRIPSHWNLSRIGAQFYQRSEKVDDTEYPPLSVTKTGVVPQMAHVAKTDANDNRKKVCKGDFVINSRSDRKGSSGTSDYDGSVSLISIVLTPKNYSPRFAHHLFRSYPFQEEFYRHGRGIVADLWSTRFSEMKGIVIPDISLEEQEAIAQYLDKETLRIDQLIAEKQKFVSLLEEKRQALISHVVTKGLDPDVEMKYSGNEWIGHIPKHWLCGQVGYYASLNTGATPSRDKSEYWGGDIPWVKTGEVRYTTISTTEETITLEGVRNSSVKISPPGTLIMAMYGQGVTRGRVAILGTEATYNQACVAISPNEKLNVEYLRYFYIAAYDQLRNIGNLTSQMNLNADLVKKFKILKPPIEEQAQIVSQLDKKTKALNELETETKRSVELLNERRSSLISAAVTGKIDVRDQIK